MSFSNLKVEELASVAEFFNKDVVAVSEDKPTKKEYLAALATKEEDSEPVSWQDYQEIYLPQKAEFVKTEPEPAPVVQNVEEAKAEEESEKAEEVDESNFLVIKCERKNSAYEVAGLVFSKEHPYQAIDPETAEYIIRNVPGFRQALPSEVAEYYG